jgi:hypothetical protein
VLLAIVFPTVEAAQAPVGRGRRWAHFALALLVAGVVMAPFYLPILPILVKKTIVHAGGAADGAASPFSLESARFHLEALPRKLLGWPLTLTVAAGTTALLWSAVSARRAAAFLAIWAVSLYAFFTFAVANKQSRYLLPWLPVLLLMAAGGWCALWRRTSSGPFWGRAAVLAVAVLPVVGLAGDWRSEDSGDWNIRPLVSRLEEDLPRRLAPSQKVARLGVIPDMREVNGPTIAYFVARRELPVTVVQLVNRMKQHVSMDVGLDPFGRGDFYETFDRYDFLATKNGENAVPPWESVVPAMQAYFESRIAEFELLGSYREPDGSTLSLYGRRRG